MNKHRSRKKYRKTNKIGHIYSYESDIVDTASQPPTEATHVIVLGDRHPKLGKHAQESSLSLRCIVNALELLSSSRMRVQFHRLPMAHHR